MDVWIVFNFWPLWIVLLWTFMYRYLCGHVFSILLCIYLGVEIMGHMIIQWLTFWGAAKLYSIAAVPFYILIRNVWRFSFVHILTDSCFFSSVCVFYIIAIQVGVEWCLTVVLIGISMMTDNVEHLCMCSLAICTSSLETCLSPLPIFKNWFAFVFPF